MIRTLTLAACALAVVAAAPADARKKKKSKDIDYAATLPVAPPPAPAPNGAIFQASAGYAPLTSGNRAARVGDLITIVLVERTQASKSATQVTDRDGSIGLSPPTTGPLALFSPSDIGMGGGNSFTGKGQATQANALSGEITVTVAQVFPNGAMLVKGEKLVTLNRGDEFIQIAGLVRPEDITADNRVASTRVADARITYSGNGEVARASRQGWLQRFFSWISPF
ncbi:flagellar basal body L-ring protein FlgH [Sphingomonas gilva]|uniref:Flagellar L-ring protein n=1 Tax=Sphingomonas gilva TaxID=2305907 RepID=A0A396RXN6_9SPHN|nr:flagellar basal body L-ring protein FlgH [Sphingomonas gilva]RHW18481.1 flagellar basal body L-ring protein FlgH [Sphingomonas gilva]